MASPNIQAVLGSLGAKVILGVSDLDAIAAQILGTFTGTLAFEVSLDGRNFVAMSMLPAASDTTVTTATAPGIWFGTIPGIVQFQVRVSLYTSGSAQVLLQGQGA